MQTIYGNFIDGVKNSIFFNSQEPIVSFKKKLKALSKSTGTPLMKIQDVSVAYYGYDNWHNFRQIFLSERKMRLKNENESSRFQSYNKSGIKISKKVDNSFSNLALSANYIPILNHAMLDEVIAVNNYVIKTHFHFYLTSDEVHKIYLSWYNIFTSIGRLLIVSPNLKQIDDYESNIGFDKFKILDLSLSQELKDSKLYNKVKKIKFKSEIEKMTIFLLSYEFKNKINIGASNLDVILKEREKSLAPGEKLIDVLSVLFKENLDELNMQLILKEYNAFLNKSLWCDTDKDSLLNSDNVIIYTGNEIDEDLLIYFEFFKIYSLDRNEKERKSQYYWYYNEKINTPISC